MLDNGVALDSSPRGEEAEGGQADRSPGLRSEQRQWMMRARQHVPHTSGLP